jgi:hypothetical protein
MSVMVAHAGGDYVDVDEAARLLGVSTRHVARLGGQGELRFIGRGVVERASVTEYLQERQYSRERAWSAETAWAAVALLSGMKVDWLGETQLSRLRQRLRHMATNSHGAYELIGRARNRAEIRTYESHDFLVSSVKKDLIVVSRRGLGLASSRKDDLDGYIDLEAAERLEQRLGLRRDARGSLVLRVTALDTTLIKHLAIKGSGALAALDVAASRDARASGVGTRALQAHLTAFAQQRRATKQPTT